MIRGVRQRIALVGRARAQQELAHRRAEAHADRGDVGPDELHRVVDRHARGDRAAGRVDVEPDVATGVLALEVQQLGDELVRDLVVHLAAEHDDAFAKEHPEDLRPGVVAQRRLGERLRQHWLHLCPLHRGSGPRGLPAHRRSGLRYGLGRLAAVVAGPTHRSGVPFGRPRGRGGIGRRAGFRTQCPRDVGVRVPPPAPNRRWPLRWSALSRQRAAGFDANRLSPADLGQVPSSRAVLARCCRPSRAAARTPRGRPCPARR